MADDRATGRREPPRFRRVVLQSQEPRGTGMVRTVLAGPELDGFAVGEPAASVRLLLPTTTGLVIPEWNGNEFLFDDGSRPQIRTFTPRYVEANQLTLDVVIHQGGAVSEWLDSAVQGAWVAVSGPGRGYKVDHDAPAFLLVGDETAIPAISQLLEALPSAAQVQVIVEVAHEGEFPALPSHPMAEIRWLRRTGPAAPGDALVSAIGTADVEGGIRIWCAGEAAAMHRIRNFLFKERQLPRREATVRGYWKARE
jgi:NADPH-dependent ferric siderophore reductase